jgi:cobalt/nickel transport system permease protein
MTVFLLLLAPLASSAPDGLEWVAGQNGFIDRALEAPFKLLPDYAIPSLGSGSLSTILAGAIGTLVVAAATFALVWLARRLKRVEPVAEREVSGD